VYSKDWPAMALALIGKTCITFSFGVLFLYVNELFPTEIRTSACGSASFIGENICRLLTTVLSYCYLRVMIDIEGQLC
jgi:hypothetical protein